MGLDAEAAVEVEVEKVDLVAAEVVVAVVAPSTLQIHSCV